MLLQLKKIQQPIDIDSEDAPKILLLDWHQNRRKHRIVIAATINGKTTSIGRYLLNYEGPLEVDHKDKNPFNNKKENLRLATRAQQMMNSKPQLERKFKGVWWRDDAKIWRASIKKDGKSKNLGHFSSEVDAAKAYDKAAKKLFGEFAYLNFPEES